MKGEMLKFYAFYRIITHYIGLMYKFKYI